MSASRPGIPASRAKERYSVAYIEAIASEALCAMTEVRVDADGWDAQLSRYGQHRHCYSPAIMVQVKARTGTPSAPPSFPLDKATYDRLARPDRQLPTYLVVVYLPESPWISFHPGGTELRREAYWGPVRPGLAGKTTVRMPIPDRFDVSSLVAIMNSVTK